MKKLFLGLAFCFSMGAFAQTENTPPDIPELCEVININSENLASHCWPLSSRYYAAPGTFNFSICKSLLNEYGDEIAQMIFDSLCEYQSLPNGVKIAGFTPAGGIRE
ncbi:hypothetical protein M2306_000187 [Myroides gitamensis]|uniref:hypothetical protein n=1 Tax=Myroides odoratus TaxID=256 RepID=UPI002166F3C8|nr:hypothetical protein [Myroides odoratus]MCS4239202.1 hypothetical protein [Myroides odoratus]MDH6599493.1 hypothetical protein [Myroides gitamensis]